MDAGTVDGEPSSTEKGSPHVEVCALERPRSEMRVVRRSDLDFIVANIWECGAAARKNGVFAVRLCRCRIGDW